MKWQLTIHIFICIKRKKSKNGLQLETEQFIPHHRDI